jgi:cell division protein FtsW (lipid II flippase)
LNSKPQRIMKVMRNRPSSHLVLLAVAAVLSLIGYLAIWRSGVLRGFSPSLLLAFRDLLLFLPVAFLIVWLARRKRFKGDFSLLSIAVILFTIGQIVQYRLFTDPEYSSRQKTAARADKTNTLRQRYVNDYYDAEKKSALFGDPNYRIPLDSEREDSPTYWTLGRALTSSSTWIPIVGLLFLALAFNMLRRDDVLLWLQRHSLLIAVVSALPFAVIAILYSSGGKFLGKTTPWEPVKVSFLVGYSGILADQYRNLSLTRWGIPRLRFLIPFLIISLLPLVPFFALADFGQMLVFLGVFLTLYLVAVKRLAQVAIAGVATMVLLSSAILLIGSIKTAREIANAEAKVSVVDTLKTVPSRGIPRRVHQRFYLWTSLGQAPDPESEWWWRPDSDAAESRGLSNDDAWYNSYAFQPSQALFGVADGRFLGRGLGRGFPEIVPIADSDFVFAALAEESGLIGGVIVIIGFILLVVCGLRVAIEARDSFTKLLAAGIITALGLQALVNIGGVLRMIPMTGITLPFVSHGGWSLITSYTMLGMLLAISHRNATIQTTAPDKVRPG